MEHTRLYPEALGTLLTRLPELELVLGPQAKGGLESVRHLLQQAVGAQADGDTPGAVSQIGSAMDTLSQLAEGVGPEEAMMMRMLTERFRKALLSGENSEAERVSDVMREKSGATIRKS